MGGGVDGIIFNELFEHCRFDLLSTLNDLNRTLKPGGYLFLSTPNLKSAIGLYKYIFKHNAYGVAGDVYHEWNKIHEIGHMGHVREYTPQEVSRLLEKCDFQIKETVYRGFYRNKGKLQKMARLASKLNKSLLPMFSIVAQKC